MDKTEWKRIYCNRFLLDLKFCPLEKLFAPLATHGEVPILAGETFYPTAEHYVAAQLFRDVGILEAAVNVPNVISQKELRKYIRKVLSSVDENLVSDWRHTKMISALKTATQLKFSQYSELKALLVQTGNTVLIETSENDVDWGIGMSYENFNKWMETESLSPCSVVFWLMHCDFKPGILGANLTGRLLMTLRNEVLIEFDKECKPKIDADVYVCQICSNLNVAENVFDADADEIMLINAPKSVLTFSYPSIFIIDETSYRSVDDYVRKKCTNLASTISISSRTDVNFVENEIFAFYEKAIETNLRQNRFVREALIRTKSALLVDVRPIGAKTDFVVRHLSYNLGAFEGDCDEFESYVDRNGLAAQTLSRFWRNCSLPRLKSVGKNRLGVLLMKIRDQLLIQQNSSVSRPAFAAETLESNTFHHYLNFEKYNGRLNKTENFVTNDKISIVPQEDKRNPLNKFFTTMFTIDKTDFISLEHYFWLRRMENVSSRDFICKILSTNDASKLKLICQMWAASNTPVVDEGQISDSDIYDIGCWLKFEQNCSLAAWLLKDLNVIVEGDDQEIKSFQKFVSKWTIPVKLLLSWWTRKNFSKPFWLTDNLLGLSLMKSRQRLIDTYFSDRFNCQIEFSNVIPLLSSASAVNTTSFYVFTDYDLLSLRCNSCSFNVDDVEYSSILRFYLSKCFDCFNFSSEAKYFLVAENDLDCIKFAEETLKSSNLLIDYEIWRKENERRTMIDSIKTCSEHNEKFRQELLASERLLLIYAADDFDLGVGMNKSTFIQFINDLSLDPETFSKLYIDELCKPKCLGKNSWANALMEARVELKKDNAKFPTDESIQCSVECIFAPENKPRTDFDFAQQHSSSAQNQLKYDAVSSWDDLASPFVHLFKFVAEDKREIKSFDHVATAAESLLDRKNQALLSSFRQCFPNCTEMISSVKNDEEAYRLGQLFATTFDKMFGDKFGEAVNTFSFEDLHNLGRIAGFEQKF